MANIKLKQVLSNMSYDPIRNELHISGSSTFGLVVTGSLEITSSMIQSASLTIAGVGTFSESGSEFNVDLGDNQF